MIGLIEFLGTHEDTLSKLAEDVLRDSRAKGASSHAPGSVSASELLVQARENVQSAPWGDGPASWHLARMRRLFEAHVKAVATRAPVRVIFKRNLPTHVVATTPAADGVATDSEPSLAGDPPVAAASGKAIIATVPDLVGAIESAVLDATYDSFLAMFTAKVERLARTVHWVGEVLGMAQDVDA